MSQGDRLWVQSTLLAFLNRFRIAQIRGGKNDTASIYVLKRKKFGRIDAMGLFTIPTWSHFYFFNIIRAFSYESLMRNFHLFIFKVCTFFGRMKLAEKLILKVLMTSTKGLKLSKVLLHFTTLIWLSGKMSTMALVLWHIVFSGVIN